MTDHVNPAYKLYSFAVGIQKSITNSSILYRNIADILLLTYIMSVNLYFKFIILCTF